MTQKTLGVLELETKPLELQGCLAGAGTFQFPVKRLTVKGAFTRNVIDGDRSVEAGYVAGARRLEREGVSAIIANCGFTGIFQSSVSAAVSIPVALSALTLVPFVAKTLKPGAKVGILTYDAAKLVEDHFAGAGWSSRDISVAVAGIDGSDLWHEFAKPAPNVTAPMLIEGVVTATNRLLSSNPDVEALVFECTAFPVAADVVRQQTGLRVADVLTLANMLIEMSPERDFS